MTPPLVSIVIVNYNSRDVLKKCLTSIVESRPTFFYDISVIDNASDEKVNDLCREFPAIAFVFNERNVGFAAANNIGIGRTRGRYVLLLNPDTIVNENSFKSMIDILELNPDVGIVGCKIFNAEGEVEHSTHSFPTLLKEFVHANEFIKPLFGYASLPTRVLKRLMKIKALESYWEHDSERIVDHVTGACMMVRREAIEKAGSFDEAFFLYNEEVEWSYRMKNAGYKSVFSPQSHIVHLFGHSTKQRVQKQTINALLVERYRGMFYFFQKHYRPAELAGLRIIVLEGFALRLGLSYIRKIRSGLAGQAMNDEIRNIRKIIHLAFQTNFDWREGL